MAFSFEHEPTSEHFSAKAPLNNSKYDLGSTPTLTIIAVKHQHTAALLKVQIFFDLMPIFPESDLFFDWKTARIAMKHLHAAALLAIHGFFAQVTNLFKWASFLSEMPAHVVVMAFMWMKNILNQ